MTLHRLRCQSEATRRVLKRAINNHSEGREGRKGEREGRERARERRGGKTNDRQNTGKCCKSINGK